MSVLEFTPRRWQIVISWLLFAVCLPLAAWLGRVGHDTFWWVLGHDAVQALGAAALVFGGVAALIKVLVSRRWTRELQVIAVDLLDETIHHVGVLSQLTAYVLFGRSGSVGELGHPFQLPWTFFDDAKIKVAMDAVRDAYSVVRDDIENVTRLQEVSAELTNRGDKLRDAAVGLDRCINDPKPVIPLLAAVAEFNRKIRLLNDEVPSPGFLVPPTPAQISSFAYEVLDESVMVAGFIRAPFQQIRGDLRCAALTKQLNDQEERLKITAGFDEGLRNMQALVRQMDSVIRQRDAMSKRTAENAKQAQNLASDLARDAKNEDLTDSEKEIADDLSERLNIIAEALSGAHRIVSASTSAAPQDAAPDPEGDGGKESDG